MEIGGVLVVSRMRTTRTCRVECEREIGVGSESIEFARQPAIA